MNFSKLTSLKIIESFRKILNYFGIYAKPGRESKLNSSTIRRTTNKSSMKCQLLLLLTVLINIESLGSDSGSENESQTIIEGNTRANTAGGDSKNTFARCWCVHNMFPHHHLVIQLKEIKKNPRIDHAKSCRNLISRFGSPFRLSVVQELWWRLIRVEPNWQLTNQRLQFGTHEYYDRRQGSFDPRAEESAWNKF